MGGVKLPLALAELGLIGQEAQHGDTLGATSDGRQREFSSRHWPITCIRWSEYSPRDHTLRVCCILTSKTTGPP